MPVPIWRGSSAKLWVPACSAAYALVHATTSIWSTVVAVRDRNAVGVARMAVQSAASLVLLAPAICAGFPNSPPRAVFLGALATLLMLAANASLHVLALYNIGRSSPFTSFSCWMSSLQCVVTFVTSAASAPFAFQELSHWRSTSGVRRSLSRRKTESSYHDCEYSCSFLLLVTLFHAAAFLVVHVVDVIVCSGCANRSPVVSSLLDLLSSILVLSITIPAIARICCTLLQSVPRKSMISLRAKVDTLSACDACLHVQSYHFWEEIPGVISGTLSLEARSDVKANSVIAAANEIFAGAVQHLTVQVEFVDRADEIVIDSSFGTDHHLVVHTQYASTGLTAENPAQR